MKLEDLLGEDLYKQVKEKIDEANKGQEDKQKMIRFVDLSEGAYVAKGKFEDLQTDHKGKISELESATKLIEELKKSTEADSALQSKISTYESEISTLKEENETLKKDNALRFALSQAGGTDMDYLLYKAKLSGEILLDDNGRLKNQESLLNTLKNDHPNLFSGDMGHKKIEPNNLPRGGQGETITIEQFNKMGYQERLKLFKDNPESYNELTNTKKG